MFSIPFWGYFSTSTLHFRSYFPFPANPPIIFRLCCQGDDCHDHGSRITESLFRVIIIHNLIVQRLPGD